MQILVLGATGVLGRQVIPRLVERGHRVRAVVRRAVVRRPEATLALAAAGVEVVGGDILEPASLQAAAAGCEAALHLATAIPKPGGDWGRNDRIRLEGTRHLLDAAAANGVRRYVQQSIVMLYGDTGQAIVDETAPLQVTGVIQSAAGMEQMVQAAALDWCILRGGLFYGAGAGLEDEWRPAAQAGTLELPGDGRDLISLIHVVDMARAVVLAAEGAPPRSIYNVVDDEPAHYADLLAYVAAQLGAPAPLPGGARRRASFGCSNARIKRELGWQPAFPSYRSGLA